jgi:hypothetical protein
MVSPSQTVDGDVSLNMINCNNFARVDWDKFSSNF